MTDQGCVSGQAFLESLKDLYAGDVIMAGLLIDLFKFFDK
jgi:hypothetical protein